MFLGDPFPSPLMESDCAGSTKVNSDQSASAPSSGLHRRRSAPPVPGRHRKHQHLDHRPRVDPKTPRRFPLAHTFDLNRKTNPSVNLHALHPPAPAASDKGDRLPDFYSGATGLPAASVRDLCSGAYTMSADSTRIKLLTLQASDIPRWRQSCSGRAPCRPQCMDRRFELSFLQRSVRNELFG